ncbi:MAG: hypothetical protein ACTHU0_36805 [Kofleriaceae bacterium]
MRALMVAAIALLAGCPMMGPETGGECFVDRECASGEICARDGQCAAPSAVREVKAVWTMHGLPANKATCADHRELYIMFEGSNPGEDLGFAPVPCENGQFFIDRLPTSYHRVEIGQEHGSGVAFGTIDAAGQAILDLQF